MKSRTRKTEKTAKIEWARWDSNPHVAMKRPRILSPLRLPFRHGPEEADSTEDKAILEAVWKKDWERLGVLLGVQDQELGLLIASWPSLSARQRTALSALAAQ